MAQPAAEVAIDEALVRALLEEQHPDLAALALRRLDAGWDNDVWRLGDHLAVRLPRRAGGAWLAATVEHPWLPVLAPGLPLPVPVPERLGEPGCGYPWPWSVVRFLEGQPAVDRPLDDGPAAAAAVAGFLRALHQPAPTDAPTNVHRSSVPLAQRRPSFERELEQVRAVVDPAAVRATFEEGAEAPPWDRPPTWVHGDLHPANVLVADGTLVGVLDFGDLHAGDPACDLAAAWTLLPAGAATPCLEAYGHVDAATLARARGWAAATSTMLLAIGLAGRRGEVGGKPTWEAPARAALRRLLA